jgi:hypothetical protein
MNRIALRRYTISGQFPFPPQPLIAFPGKLDNDRTPFRVEPFQEPQHVLSGHGGAPGGTGILITPDVKENAASGPFHRFESIVTDQYCIAVKIIITEHSLVRGQVCRIKAFFVEINHHVIVFRAYVIKTDEIGSGLDIRKFGLHAARRGIPERMEEFVRPGGRFAVTLMFNRLKGRTVVVIVKSPAPCQAVAAEDNRT